MDLCDPVSIVLVTAGSRGQSLLFRYPFIAPCRTEQKEKGNLHGIYHWAIAFNIRINQSINNQRKKIHKNSQSRGLKWPKVSKKKKDVKNLQE